MGAAGMIRTPLHDWKGHQKVLFICGRSIYRAPRDGRRRSLGLQTVVGDGHDRHVWRAQAEFNLWEGCSRWRSGISWTDKLCEVVSIYRGLFLVVAVIFSS